MPLGRTLKIKISVAAKAAVDLDQTLFAAHCL
jgi:hypothetical protein